MKTVKKVLALVLVLMMAVSAVPMVFAADDQPAEQNLVEKVTVHSIEELNRALQNAEVYGVVVEGVPELTEDLQIPFGKEVEFAQPLTVPAEVSVTVDGSLVLSQGGDLYGADQTVPFASLITVSETGSMVVDGSLLVHAGEKPAKLIVWGSLTGEGTVDSQGETRICGTYSVRTLGNVWAPFLDTKVNSWYHKAVVYGVEHEMFKGLGEGLFGVYEDMSRAQLVTVLYRMEGQPDVDGIENPFRDVGSGRYYADAVKWAYDSGVVKGISSTKFAPNDPITRQQMATIMYRYAQYCGEDVSHTNNLHRFEDVEDVSGYAMKAVKWAVAEDLIHGTLHDGNFYLEPEASASRAQLATIIYRYLTRP